MGAGRILRGSEERDLAGWTLLGRLSHRTDGCLVKELLALFVLLLEWSHCSLRRRFPHPQ
jgi:hypothetical protein